MLFIVAILAAVVAFFVYKNAKKRFSKPEITFSLLGIVVAVAVAASASAVAASAAAVVGFAVTVAVVVYQQQ